jgi:hypothetical protein
MKLYEVENIARDKLVRELFPPMALQPTLGLVLLCIEVC